MFLRGTLGILTLALGFLSAPLAARAELFGGIEIGAKGIKLTVVDATAIPEGIEMKVVGSGSANATLVAGLAKDGKFAPEALKEATDIVAKFLAQLKEEHKVKAENIFLVGSSGITSPVESEPEKVKSTRETLAKVMLDGVGLKMDFIDARREAELSIKGMVPTRYRDEAMLVDVGSGNTKGGYLDAEGKYVIFAAPWGTSSLAAKAFAGNGTFAEKLGQIKSELLAPALAKELKTSNQFVQRKRVYFSGGAVWAAITLTNFEKKNAYVPISARNFADLEAKLLKDPATFPAPDLSNVTDEELKKTLSKEIDRVKNVYKPEQILAGTTILKLVATELELDKEGKSLYFVRDGHLGWITAYVSEKVK